MICISSLFISGYIYHNVIGIYIHFNKKFNKCEIRNERQLVVYNFQLTRN